MQINVPPTSHENSESRRARRAKARGPGAIEINSPARSSRSGVRSGANSGKYPCRINVRSRPAMPRLVHKSLLSPRKPPDAKRRYRRCCSGCRDRPSGRRAKRGPTRKPAAVQHDQRQTAMTDGVSINCHAAGRSGQQRGHRHDRRQAQQLPPEGPADSTADGPGSPTSGRQRDTSWRASRCATATCRPARRPARGPTVARRPSTRSPNGLPAL